MKRNNMLTEAKVTWLEEPFYSDAFYEYSELAKQSSLSLAGGESCHSVESAKRSEEHTSELQSQAYLVCRLLLEKKKKTNTNQQ